MEKKMQVTFDHGKDSLGDSLGVEKHKYASQLAAIMTLIASDGLTKGSEISEMMHKCVDYNILLMLATNRLLDMIVEFEGEPFNRLSQN